MSAVVTLKDASAAQFPGPIVLRAPLLNAASVVLAPVGAFLTLGAAKAGGAIIVSTGDVSREHLIAASIILPLMLAMGALSLKLGFDPLYPRRATLTLDENALTVDYSGKRGRFLWSDVDRFQVALTPRLGEHALFNSASEGPFRVAGWDFVTKGRAHLLPGCFGAARPLVRLLQEWRDRAVQSERRCED